MAYARSIASSVIRRRSSGFSRTCTSKFKRVFSSVPTKAHQTSEKPLSLTVPKGTAPGQRFIVKGREGQSISVVLPANTAPGQRFEVTIPLRKAAAAGAQALNSGKDLWKVNGAALPYDKAPETNAANSDDVTLLPLLSVKSLAGDLQLLVQRRTNLLASARDEVALHEASLHSLQQELDLVQERARELSIVAAVSSQTAGSFEPVAHVCQMNGANHLEQQHPSASATVGARLAESPKAVSLIDETPTVSAQAMDGHEHKMDGACNSSSLYICYEGARNNKRDKKDHEVQKKLVSILAPFGDVRKFKFPKHAKGEMSNLNKRIAFVTMPDTAAAEAARKALDTKDFRVLPVYKDSTCRVYVGNLPRHQDGAAAINEYLAKLVAPYGRLLSVQLHKSRARSVTLGGRSHAFLQLNSTQGAYKAIQALNRERASGLEANGPPLVWAMSEMSDGEERTYRKHLETLHTEMPFHAAEQPPREAEASVTAMAAQTSKEKFFEYLTSAKMKSHSKMQKQFIDGMVRRHALGLSQKEFNTILRVFAYGGEFTRCLNLCALFEKLNFRMDGETYGYLITSNLQSDNFDIHAVMRIFEKMKKDQIMPDIITVNKVLGTCWKRSNLAGAQVVWDRMPLLSLTPNRDTFRSIIGLKSQTFDVEKVVQYMQEMENMGLKPDQATFSFAIRSCNKDTARAHDFVRLMQQYGHQPTLIHYTELLHVYIRSDRMPQIADLVASMRGEGIVLDDVFVTAWGLGYLKTGDWHSCVNVLATNSKDFERSMRYQLSVMLCKLKKFKQWQGMTDLFSFFNNSTSGRAAIQGAHLVHVIQAQGHLANWEEVLSLHDRLEVLLAAERGVSHNSSLSNQVSKTVGAAHHFIGKQAEEKSHGEDVDRITVHIET